MNIQKSNFSIHIDRISFLIITSGICSLLIWYGSLKFINIDDNSIMELSQDSWLVSNLYSIFDGKSIAYYIGFVEILAGMLLFLGLVFKQFLFLGSTFAILIFSISCFLLIAYGNMFTYQHDILIPLQAGAIVFEDLILLGASIHLFGKSIIII